MFSAASQDSGCKTDLEDGLDVGAPLMMSHEQVLSSRCAESQDTDSGFCPRGVQGAGGVPIPRQQNPRYCRQRSGSLRSLVSQGVESGFDSSDEAACDLLDPDDGPGTKHTDEPQVPESAGQNLRDLICKYEMTPRKDKAIFEIPEDALGPQDGSTTKGTELSKVQDPAGHKQGKVTSLLEQSESCPEKGIGKEPQDGSATGLPQRNTFRASLGEWFRSHPVLTLAVLIELLLLALLLALALALCSGRRQTEFPATPGTPQLLACPDDLLGYRGKCYNLSRDPRSWDQARAECSELGASLAVLKDREMDFFFCLSKKDDYWVGLRRREQGLQWEDGSNFSSSVEVLGEGDCVFLGNGKFWRGSCSNLRPYLCSRPQSRL